VIIRQLTVAPLAGTRFAGTCPGHEANGADPRPLAATAWRRGMGCGAKGVMTLGQEKDIAGEEMLNMQHLEASPDGNFVLLVETERSEWGVQQQTCYRMPAKRLIQLFKNEGERLDG
jgi:hypothetical protein